MKNCQSDLTEGAVGQGIIKFAAPLFVGNLFQQLYNTVDSLIVGNYLGHQGLAAVSATSNLIFLLVGFMNGLSTGAGVFIAWQFGARRLKEMSVTIHTLVGFGLIASGILTLFGVSLSKKILVLMNTPHSVIKDASNYFQIYFTGVIGLVMYNIFASILQSTGNSRQPLYYLTLSSVTNVILDIIFIRVLGWGVWSAAFATILSQVCSAFFCFLQLLHTEESYRITLKNIHIDKQTLKEIIKFGLPSGLQNSVIGLSNVFIQSQINIFGDTAIAGCGAYQKIEGFGLLPITSISLALTTYIGQNAGAGKEKRIRKGAKFGLVCSMILAELIGVTIFVAAPYFVSAFNTNQEVLQVGVDYARTVTLFYFLPSYTHNLAAVFRGKGKPILSMIVILSFWCISRVALLMLAIHFIPSIQIVYWVYPLTWLLSSVVFGVLYLKEIRE